MGTGSACGALTWALCRGFLLCCRQEVALLLVLVSIVTPSSVLCGLVPYFVLSDAFAFLSSQLS